MNALVMAGQMILALSILISLHELGHYLAARMFGIRVEKFYLFFDAWGFKLFSFKKGDTEYGIGWLPLGGYVKISGMIDESLDTKQLAQEPQSWEFRSKPAWQRLIVMLAGVTVNFILGILIFGFALFYYGDEYLPASEVKYGISTSEMARKIGFQDGDQVMKINGRQIERFNEVYDADIFLDKTVVFTVKRNDSLLDITLPADMADQVAEMPKKGFIGFRFKARVEKVEVNSNAEKAGLLEGDRILAVNDSNTEFFHDFQAKLAQHKGDIIKLLVLRNGEEITTKAEVTEEGMLGFKPEPIELNFKKDFYPFGKSMAVGTQRAKESLVDNIRGLGKVVRGEIDPSKSLMGPIRLATFFGGDWNWERFWSLTGILSLILAFMNLLPIPALDGGHALFLFIEMIIGRPLGDKFMQVTQVIGMVILLALMIFVFGNDIWNLLPWK